MPRTDPSDIFYGTSGPTDARIMQVAESWGKTEEAKLIPLCGQSGQANDVLLSECGLNRDDIFSTNVVSAKPAGNDMKQFFYTTKQGNAEKKLKVKGLFPKEEVLLGVDTLRKQIEAVKPEVIIAYGNYALWALTDDCFNIKDELGYKTPTGITQWRGSQLYASEEMGGVKVLPTYHPAAWQRQWAWRYAVRHDLRKRIPLALNNNWDPPAYQFQLRPTFEQVVAQLGSLLEHADNFGDLTIASDLETRAGHIACAGIAWNELQAICIPFMCVEDKTGYWSEHEEIQIIQMLRRLLTHPGVKVIGQNYLYDAQYIALYWHMLSTCWRDTMYTHWVCWPGTPKGLAYLSSLYCAYHRFWKDEGKEWVAKMEEEILWNYNCIDCVTTFECNKVLTDIARQLGLEEQVQDQMDDFPLLLDMMMRGVKQDLVARSQVLAELMEVIAQKERELEPMVPVEIWPRIPKAAPWYRSDTQLRQIFYEVLGQPIRREKSKKRISVNKDCLAMIGQHEPLLRGITVRLEELRSLNKFREVCVWKLDSDHRARCMYDPSGTKTFRFNSKKSAWGTSGNMQTMSKGHEDFGA